MNIFKYGFKAFLAGLLLYGTASAVQIHGTINPSITGETANGDSCSATFKPIRPYGTSKGIVSNDSSFYSAFFPSNMNPPKRMGDTLEVKVWDNQGHLTQFKYLVKTLGDERVWDSHVSSNPSKNYTINVPIQDNSGVQGNMIAQLWYDDNPGEVVSREIPAGWANHYSNYRENFDNLSANATDDRAYTIMVTKPGVNGYTEIHATVNRDLGNANELAQKIFPESFYGIQEQEQNVETNKPRTYFVMPGQTMRGTFYNVSGQKVNSIKEKGVYFSDKGDKYIKVR